MPPLHEGDGIFPPANRAADLILQFPVNVQSEVIAILRADLPVELKGARPVEGRFHPGELVVIDVPAPCGLHSLPGRRCGQDPVHVAPCGVAEVEPLESLIELEGGDVPLGAVVEHTVHIGCPDVPFDVPVVLPVPLQMDRIHMQGRVRGDGIDDCHRYVADDQNGGDLVAPEPVVILHLHEDGVMTPKEARFREVSIGAIVELPLEVRSPHIPHDSSVIRTMSREQNVIIRARRSGIDGIDVGSRPSVDGKGRVHLLAPEPEIVPHFEEYGVGAVGESVMGEQPPGVIVDDPVQAASPGVPHDGTIVRTRPVEGNDVSIECRVWIDAFDGGIRDPRDGELPADLVAPDAVVVPNLQEYGVDPEREVRIRERGAGVIVELPVQGGTPCISLDVPFIRAASPVEHILTDQRGIRGDGDDPCSWLAVDRDGGAHLVAPDIVVVPDPQEDQMGPVGQVGIVELGIRSRIEGTVEVRTPFVPVDGAVTIGPVPLEMNGISVQCRVRGDGIDEGLGLQGDDLQRTHLVAPDILVVHHHHGDGVFAQGKVIFPGGLVQSIVQGPGDAGIPDDPGDAPVIGGPSLEGHVLAQEGRVRGAVVDVGPGPPLDPQLVRYLVAPAPVIVHDLQIDVVGPVGKAIVGELGFCSPVELPVAAALPCILLDGPVVGPAPPEIDVVGVQGILWTDLLDGGYGPIVDKKGG